MTAMRHHCNRFMLRLANNGWLLFLMILLTLAFGAATYMLFEPDKDWLTSSYFSIVAGFTIGFGDQFPVGVLGRLSAICLIITMWYLSLLASSNVTARLVYKRNAWNHLEQEKYLASLLRKLKHFGLIHQDATQLPLPPNYVPESALLPKGPLLRFANNGRAITIAIIVVIIGSAAGYSITEGKDWFTSVWFAIVAGWTVGFGDQFPVTPDGRLVCILLIASMWFLSLLANAYITSRQITDNDEWTHEEQERALYAELLLDIHFGLVPEYFVKLPPPGWTIGDPEPLECLPAYV